ncbi:T9SS sorting signal type C domain-containing protein [Flavobacterium sp.]|jgi:autotransporter-associated beta strand protein|uniref:T9SS sorting signal type C domain-containing protein n=1 Tax=Flavobacterium sp. TaxID=239 RepID=UPI0037BF5B62
MKKFLLILFTFFSLFGFSQQDVFNRSDSNTGDFGSGNLPWFYQTSNNNQGDPDNGNTVSNNVKIGHNNFTTMITNGRFYRVRTLEFQTAATSNRTINNSGGGLGVSFGVYNNSSGSHIFNTPIGIDGATVQLQANSGPFTFTTDIFMNANTVEFGGSNNTLVSGILQGTGKLVKNGTGFLTLSNTNTYSGNTELDNGELWIETTGNAIANNNIFLGNGGLLGNTTKIFLSRTAGGTTFSRNINVNPGNANTRFLGSLNTSGTNTFSGSILRSGTGRPLTIEVVNAGGTVAFTGVINGSDNITKIGPGTMQLGTSNSTMTGTWFVENGTLLTDSFPARIGGARPITLGTASTSGTLRFTGTSATTTTATLAVNAGGGSIFNASATNFSFSNSFALGGTLTVGAESTGTLRFTGTISGSNGVVIAGTGKVAYESAAKTYTGTTRLNSGTLEPTAANYIANTSNFIFNGGTYSTGATTGYSDTVGTLQLLENSTIRLGDGGNTHTLTFAASNGVSWTSGRTLTITNWSGTPGTGGTASAGSIFVGAAATSLTAAQLDQITFQGYEPGAVLKSTGELMPKGYITYYSKGSLAPEVLTNWSLTTDGTGASPANFTSTARFVIQNGHTMTTGAAWTLSGASTTLQILNGGTLVSTFAITIPTTGIFQIDNGGLYKHDNTSTYATTIFRTGATVILGNSSTVEINKTNSAMPTLTSYGNLTIDLSVDPGAAMSFGGNLATVNGNFIVKHTRTRQVRLAANSGPTITVVGNFEVHPNADFTIVTGTGNTTLNVDGNINLVGGTFSLATSSGVGFLVARGPSVTISENVTFAGLIPGATGFYFNRNVEQTLTIAHPFSSGNVRNRFFVSTINSNVINEVYNGVAAQTTIDGAGAAPGTGWSAWPTATGGTALKSFTINNSAGVTLSTNRFVNTTLGLTNGTITPGANSLTLAATATFTGGSATSHVNGVLNRVYTTTGSAVFPVGKAGVYRPVGFQYTALTGTSTVSVNQIETALTGTLPADTNLNNARTWDISQTGGSAFTYNVTLDPTGDTTTGTVVMLKRESGTTTSNATITPNFTNATGFITLTGTNNFTLGSTCTVTSNAGANQTDCIGTVFTLAANTPSFGTGAWTVSGPSTNASQFSNTASPTSTFTADGGAGTYTLTWTITNGSCTANSNLTVTLNPLPTASISGNNGPTLCSGSDITFTLTGTSGAVVTYNLNGGATATATLTGGSATVTVTAATATQTLNLVSVTDGTCPATLSGSSTVSVGGVVTWDGTSWSPSAPTATSAVIFTGNYTIGANFDACTITVNNNAVVSVTSGFNVNLNGAITVATGSSFTLNNNANLLQSNPAAVNTGNIIVKRQSNPLIRLDYTLWSSPVTGQGLYAFSPFTFDNRFYVYNTTSNLYNNSSIGFNVTGTNAAGVNGTDNANVLFTTGKGYLIRLPYNHPTAPIVFNGSFTGVPNNGTKTITLANVSATQQFNAVGNPYPSPINIAQFATDNTNAIEPTLYFWRKTNNALSASYCTWNTTSGLYGDNGEAFTNSPNGVIQTGQGFLVEAKDGATSLEFNNGQRVANNANQFFRTTTVATPTTQADAIWLNLTGTGAEFSQAVVSYFTNATLGADAYDSKYFNDGAVALNMLIGSTEYVIQGRPTFQATDVVPLNYKVTTAGNYTFAIDHVEGLFSTGQLIYIKDNQDGSYHNLSSPYTFTSAAGTFANRFELVYQTALTTNDNNFTANSINVIKQQNDVVVRTSGTTMQEVTIYDIRGRVLVTKTNINASETKINVGTTNQVLLVQVTTVDGFKATKKVVN